MKYVVLPAGRLKELQQYLIEKNHVAAPVRRGEASFSFAHVVSADDISEEYLPTALPPKKYYMPQHETLLEFDVTDGHQNMQAYADVQPMVLYGVRTCDIAGIQCLNLVFSDRPKDVHYLLRKNEIRIIGVECDAPCDSFSSCGLMNNYTPNGGYDLFITELDGIVMIHVNTYEGEEMLRGFDGLKGACHTELEMLKSYRAAKHSRFQNEPAVELMRIPEIFDKTYDSGVWQELGRKCVSCANCTNVCPTCYCFDVVDEMDMNMTTGRRMRVWDSCQNDSFAIVAGGENFREQRSDRKRHRFHRKFKYPVDRYGRFFCTGCGRCSRMCMAGINLKETIKKLAEETGEL